MWDGNGCRIGQRPYSYAVRTSGTPTKIACRFESYDYISLDCLKVWSGPYVSGSTKTESGLGLGIEKMSNSNERPKGGQNEVENRWKVNLKGKENKNRPNDARKWKIRAIFSN
jgi:hypothetical protein